MKNVLLGTLAALTVAPVVAMAGNDISFSQPSYPIIRESGKNRGEWQYRPVRANDASVDQFCYEQGFYRGGYVVSTFFEDGAVASYGYNGWSENNGEQAVARLKCRNNK